MPPGPSPQQGGGQGEKGVPRRITQRGRPKAHPCDQVQRSHESRLVSAGGQGCLLGEKVKPPLLWEGGERNVQPDAELQAGRARAGPFGQAGFGSGPAGCMGSRAGLWGLPALVRAPSPRGTTEWPRGARLGLPLGTPGCSAGGGGHIWAPHTRPLDHTRAILSSVHPAPFSDSTWTQTP